MKKLKALFSLAAAVAIVASGGTAALGQISVETVLAGSLFEPFAVASNNDGDSYVTDSSNHRIIKVPAGTSFAQLLAGGGIAGTNNGPGTAARFNQPQGIVLARGGLVVADSANHTIRFVTLNGIVTTLAGAPGEFGLVNGPGNQARFRFPAGLSVDAEDNIYIADLQNNAIRKLDVDNNVTTVATGFFQPAGLSVAPNGEIWVTDTRRHCIKVIDTNGMVNLVAGVPNVAGSADSSVATEALFTAPRGILFLGGSGVLVADTGNHTIRRIYFNTDYNTYSVETFAGTPGFAGLENGPALSAKFNSPIGLAKDLLGGGFLVVDKANSQLRRINTGAVQPPVRDPIIGWVDIIETPFGPRLHLVPVIASTFNNEVVIAIDGEAGTQTYYTLGATPLDPLNDTVPHPGPGTGQTPPYFEEGDFVVNMPPTLTPPQPDLTIKAVGTQDGRRSSQIVRARFQFKVGNPVIVGDNAASFRVDNVTRDALMYYTWDGSEPTNNPAANPAVQGPIGPGETISFNLGGIERTFKIKAFRENFKPSDTMSKTFSPSSFIANTISFGFEMGEASSEFVAAAGQRFYAPVTLTVLPEQKIYSLQFNVVVTNETGPGVNGNLVAFDSTLVKPVQTERGLVYITIPPAMANMSGDPINIYDSLLNTNASIGLLGVGWIERFQHTNLYNTLQQDLITYSLPHDRLFQSRNGQVVAGAYSFIIPPEASVGATYRIDLGRASATSDGISKDVFIRIPTNGSLTAGPINGQKRVTVGIRQYVVGDVAPFRWFNAGDFGDTNLLNNDVLQIFQSAVYRENRPPDGSDMMDAMDCSDGSTHIYNGGNYSVDDIRFGDGILAIDDVFVAFRRSIDPSLKWFARYWSNGVRQAVEVPNRLTTETLPPAPLPPAPKFTPAIQRPSVVISADDIVGAPGTTVHVPVRVRISGSSPLRVLMLNMTLQPLDGAPSITQTIGFQSVAALGNPTMQSSRAANNLALAWLNNGVTGVIGDALLGTVVVNVPAGASPSAAYRLHFEHFSGSPDGVLLFRTHVYDGLITTTSRTSSSLGDEIPDLWRLRYFGSVNSPLAAANADPDRDNVTNAAEFRAGTNPLDLSSVLRLDASGRRGSSVNFTFPTGTGRTYVIESAPVLNGPWSPISTNTGNGGVSEFSDAPGTNNRFYRVRTQ